MLRAKKGQATTELVVLGSLIIVAFAFLMQYSEKLNRQQAYIQQTFRAALKAARTANNSASYTKIAFRRMANITNPMELGQQQTFSNSNNVIWADGKSKDEHGVSKYQLNEEPAIDIPYRDTPAEGTVEVSRSSFINTTDATATSLKQEASGGIVTTKALVARDTLQADVDVSGNTYSFTQSLGEETLASGEKVGGKYYPGGNSLQRQRSMQ